MIIGIVENYTPKKKNKTIQTQRTNHLTDDEIDEQENAPETPKSDFGNFAEGILSPSALDTPIVPFTTTVLTPSSRLISPPFNHPFILFLISCL